MKRRLPSLYLLVLGSCFLAYAVLLVWPWLTGQSPYTNHLTALMLPPNGAFLLGSDELGRDILSRLALGFRLSIGVGMSVALFTGLIGVTLGLVSGYVGGWLDSLLMRITDVFLAFPGILLAIAFAAVAGPGIGNVVLALCLMGWVGFARLARAQALSLRQREFVQAAQVAGTPSWRILLAHVLPNAAAPLIVEGVFTVAGAMIAEAGLSFLGIGVQPPYPSLGSMLREGARYMLVAPHLVLAPGLTLMSLVLVLNILGDRLRDRLDARCA